METIEEKRKELRKANKQKLDFLKEWTLLRLRKAKTKKEKVQRETYLSLILEELKRRNK